VDFLSVEEGEGGCGDTDGPETDTADESHELLIGLFFHGDQEDFDFALLFGVEDLEFDHGLFEGKGNELAGFEVDDLSQAGSRGAGETDSSEENGVSRHAENSAPGGDFVFFDETSHGSYDGGVAFVFEGVWADGDGSREHSHDSNATTVDGHFRQFDGMTAEIKTYTSFCSSHWRLSPSRGISTIPGQLRSPFR